MLVYTFILLKGRIQYHSVYYDQSQSLLLYINISGLLIFSHSFLRFFPFYLDYYICCYCCLWCVLLDFCFFASSCPVDCPFALRVYCLQREFYIHTQSTQSVKGMCVAAFEDLTTDTKKRSCLWLLKGKWANTNSSLTLTLCNTNGSSLFIVGCCGHLGMTIMGVFFTSIWIFYLPRSASGKTSCPCQILKINHFD